MSVCFMKQCLCPILQHLWAELSLLCKQPLSPPPGLYWQLHWILADAIKPKRKKKKQQTVTAEIKEFYQQVSAEQGCASTDFLSSQ